MSNPEKLQNMRHTLAHLLASAVLEFHPDAKSTIGPAIDDGFYYDFEFSSPISEKDLEKIEKKMKENLKSWVKFTHEEKTAEEAKKYFANNPYKLELIDEIINKGEKITFYTCGGPAPSEAVGFRSGFTDLCRGGHAENPSKEISPDAFKLDRLAGAYWRGDEKNKMLTRIYGLAFTTKEELEAYIIQREEAKKRDHKKLGVELDLFTFSEIVGAGLPLFTPKGTKVRDLLDSFVWELRKGAGYEKVDIPHITKKELYEISGHWDKFKDDLFRINTREGHEFAMKPMNCPHHTQIYNRRQWSYKELPQRYTSTTKVYRDEQTGELGGLSRVRSITQDDAHVFCRLKDAGEEMEKIYKIVKTFYGAFGFILKPRLSLHDPKEMEKYLGTKEAWESSENALREIIKINGETPIEAVGEAAFYGPKIDFMAKDAIGREHQVATIQLDMNMPERFDLYCINEKGEQERIVMIHAAIMGSIERFMSVLIEHVAGAFPTWLSPIQVYIAPINKDKHLEYAEKVKQTLRENDIRAEIAYEDNSFGKKIWEFSKQQIPYLVIIGDRQMEEKNISFQTRKKSADAPNLDVDMKIEEFINILKEEIKEKK